MSHLRIFSVYTLTPTMGAAFRREIEESSTKTFFHMLHASRSPLALRSKKLRYNKFVFLKLLAYIEEVYSTLTFKVKEQGEFSANFYRRRISGQMPGQWISSYQWLTTSWGFSQYLWRPITRNSCYSVIKILHKGRELYITRTIFFKLHSK